jgi:hypothetical protein
MPAVSGGVRFPENFAILAPLPFPRLHRPLLALAMAFSLSAQTSPARAEDPELTRLRLAYDKDRDGISLAFASMGLFNVSIGVSTLIATRDTFWTAFALEAAGFGGINFGSAVGWLLLRPGMDKELTSIASVNHQRHALHRGTLIGMAFEVAYVIGGALLWALPKHDFLRGLGAGVVTQGSQTFALDVVELFWLKPP